MLRGMILASVFGALFLLGPVSPAAAELPTIEAILEIDRENRSLLSRLHLQLVHSQETTEASTKIALKELEASQKRYEFYSQLRPEDVTFTREGGEPFSDEEAERLFSSLGGRIANAEIERLKRQSQIYQYFKPMELFLDQANYQFRSPLHDFNTKAELSEWTFSSERPTPESLLTTFRDTYLFSHSTELTPHSRWWSGVSSRSAKISTKHLSDVSNRKLPPYTTAIKGDLDNQHIYDEFFSHPINCYRVVREEEVEGRLLTVIEATFSESPESKSATYYRAWLDLKRGAVPMKINRRSGLRIVPADFLDTGTYGDVHQTLEVCELPNGGFYPHRIVKESFDRDPDCEIMSPEQLEALGQKYQDIPYVVIRRESWDCSRVELLPDTEPDFFSITFPDGLNLYDHDAEKIVGGIEFAPQISAGTIAPELQISHWFDSQNHSLEEFRGKVVVLSFWELSNGACQASVSTHKQLQERFKDQDVVFISIHPAEKDTEALAAKIQEYTAQKGWNPIAAIDSGTMLENSATHAAYGLIVFPTNLVIGRDGIVQLNDMETPQELAAILDKPCHELTERELKTITDWEGKIFIEAGEEWPLPETLTEEDALEIYNRVSLFRLSRAITSALQEKIPAANE